jgi:cyclase
MSNFAKRIIPCLDVKDGRVVKGVNFVDLKDAGDIVQCAINYNNQGADELVFLDITATYEKRSTMVDVVKRVSKEVFIPLSVGGGIRELQDVYNLLDAGCDKVSINSMAIKNPDFVRQVATRFGSSNTIVAMDVKKVKDKYHIFARGGRDDTGIDAIEWAKKMQDFGAGEILLTSMDNDGVKNGFNIDITKTLGEILSIPIIASGGAGKKEHIRDVFMQTNAGGALAASIFHFGDILIPDLKQYLHNEGINVRL